METVNKQLTSENSMTQTSYAIELSENIYDTADCLPAHIWVSWVPIKTQTILLE